MLRKYIIDMKKIQHDTLNSCVRKILVSLFSLMYLKILGRVLVEHWREFPAHSACSYALSQATRHRRYHCKSLLHRPSRCQRARAWGRMYVPSKSAFRRPAGTCLWAWPFLHCTLHRRGLRSRCISASIPEYALFSL